MQKALNLWTAYLDWVRRNLGLCVLILIAASLAGCATPVVTAAPNSCSGLLPSSWREGVPPPPLPEGSQVGDWISFGDAAIGKLDVANGRTVDAITIVERCESRDAAALKHATKSWIGRLFD